MADVVKMGPRGPQGPRGERGPRGRDGRDGKEGPRGIQGPPGQDGRDGKEAVYALAVNEGFTGTEKEWLASLRGPKGDSGAPGKDGKNGARGKAGEPGPQGPAGPAGPRGPRGPAGKDGEDGLGILHGEGPPAPGLGRIGEFYIETQSMLPLRAYGPKTGEGWGAGVRMRGIDGGGGNSTTSGGGAQGPQGPQGDPGPAGADGADGADGVNGGVGYTFSTSTIDADPGAGFLRLNNGAIASVTAAYIDNVETGGNSVTGWLDSWDDSTSTVKGKLLITGSAPDSTTLALFNVTGAVVDGTGYRKVTLAYLAGVLPSNNQAIRLLFSPTGDKGDTGAAGANGAAGADGTDAGISYTFSTTTTDSDPGAGNVRFNNGTVGSVTFLYFDNTEAAAGVDVTGWLDSLDDASGSDRGKVIFIKPNGAPILFTVTGAVVDGTGYRKVPVTHVTGTLPANGDSLSVSFYPKPSAAGTKTYASWEAYEGQPPSANYATADTRGSLRCLDYDDTTAEGQYFTGRMPEGASLAGGLTVYIDWRATSATTGNVIWEVSFARLNENNQDLDSLTFDTVTLSSAAAANATSGKSTKTSITVAAADTDGIAAGDRFAIFVRRLPANASDDMPGDAELYGVAVEGV